MTTDPYSTIRQTTLLRALADYMDAAELPAGNVTSNHDGTWSFQLFTADASAALATWATASHIDALDIRPLTNQVNVSFNVTVGDTTLRVWGCVDPLRDLLNLNEVGDTRITTADLWHFATSGTLPTSPASCPVTAN